MEVNHSALVRGAETTETLALRRTRGLMNDTHTGQVTGERGKVASEQPRPPAWQRHETDAYLRTRGREDCPLLVSSAAAPPRACA